MTFTIQNFPQVHDSLSLEVVKRQSANLQRLDDLPPLIVTRRKGSSLYVRRNAHSVAPQPIRATRRRVIEFTPLEVRRNPNRGSVTSSATSTSDADLRRLRSKFAQLAGRPLRNQVTSPTLTPGEAQELLGLDEQAVRHAMATGRVCITTVKEPDGRERTGVRLSELLTHFAVGA